MSVTLVTTVIKVSSIGPSQNMVLFVLCGNGHEKFFSYTDLVFCWTTQLFLSCSSILNTILNLFCSQESCVSNTYEFERLQ